MKPPLKQCKKYYFTVEGETEKWYFEWLQRTINTTDNALYKVQFDCKIEKDPLKRAKSLVLTSPTEIYHISDYESNEDSHEKQFKETMDRLSTASKIGKQIRYKFGYSNFTFDVWIVLHRSDCNGAYIYRRQYLQAINTAYNKRFGNMDDYKKEDTFKTLLNSLNLSNVLTAIGRAQSIMNRNRENGYPLHEYKGFKYYNENPSLMIWEPVEKILKDCGLL